MAANASRRKLVNAKATTKYLEAFFDATRIQSEANDLDRDVKHAVEQQEQLARERSNWKRSKPAKRQRTLTDSATGMTSSRKRVMGYGDRASVDAELAQRTHDATQREQAARQAYAQKRTSVSSKLQRMSDIEEWGQNRYGAHRFPWPQYVNGDYAQLEAYGKLLGVDTTHDLAVGAVATPAAMLGYKAITGFTAMISPEWAQSSSRLDAFVNVFSWFTAYGQASTADAMTQGANNLNAMQWFPGTLCEFSNEKMKKHR